MTSNHYDIAIIGSGPGGYIAAVRAAQRGARVAIVEKQYLGGTCLNVGCIPSKAMLHVAETLHNIESFEELGISLPQAPVFNMPKAVTFKNKVVKRMTSGVGTLMKGNNVDVFMGQGNVDASRTVTVTGGDGQQQFSADTIILATGSVPLMPSMPGIDGKNVMNSDTCWDLPKVPESLVCVGGGIIGIELACMFNAIGSKVTVLEMLPTVLTPVDEEVRKLLVRILSKRGIEIVTGAKVEGIEEEEGQKKVIATTDKGQQEFPAEYVLMAVSRRANITGLDKLIEQGLDTDRGRVRVNDRMQTNLPGFYAIGDLVHGAGLAHVASTEGEVAADNATGQDVTMNYDVIPNPIYTFPEVAFVGLTEAAAREQYKDDVRVDRFPWAANGKAVAIGETEGFTKVIMGKYGEVLGAHIIGPDATNLISEYSLAMHGELTGDEITETIHPHPTLSEGLREAILVAEGQPLNIVLKQPVRAR